ncbi:MAG: MBL fold metallo-hydrolase [Rhodobacteraceae bacterium]|nr:MBL fold metallo-hydrolase [Paracoccaceae bacterium]
MPRAALAARAARTLALALALALGPAADAAAEVRSASHCVALAEDAPGARLVPARFGAPLAAGTVRLTYVDHATFLIETAGGLTAATDFTGFLGPGAPIPDVVTMNRAHRTHYTDFPDPAIPHVLRGWNPEGGPVDHHLDLGEMLVRNVPTDIRSRTGGGAVEPYGNSIFVFEVAGLCIGHLGHLHHEPSPAQYAMLGRLDVVMAPVDGGLTLDLPTMTGVLKRLRSSVVIPMHWFGPASLERFLEGMAGEFDIVRREENWLEVAPGSLPPRPTVVVLSPRPID